MKISGYGIELLRLRHEDIELVRQKRNSPSVKQYMEFRDEITPAMQETWFQSVNNRNNNYFVILAGGEKIGLVYGAHIDWEKKETGNGGIFIWEEKWLENPVSVIASFLLIEISFLIGLEKTYVRILRSNTRAIKFNEDLGYVLLPGQESVENQRYVLDRTIFFQRTEKFRKALRTQFGDVFHIALNPEADDAESFFLALHTQLDEASRKRIVIDRA